MAEMERKGMGGMSKMGAKFESKPKPQEDGGESEEGTSTITHHADGSHTSQMHGGEPMEHPDHLHLMAHIGHHLTGGDKHHVMHHDGMSATSHMVHEDGTHEGPMEHNSADEAKQSLDKFFNEESQEPMHEHGAAEEQEPAYGAM
jgi:hypothetical protein